MRVPFIAALFVALSACSQAPRPHTVRAISTEANSAAPSPYDEAFWQTWGDGKAEVAAYDLTVSKYGQPRKGTAVAITVAEPFSNSTRVKADPGKHPAADVFSAMKLNLIRDYQTGIYNYKDMLSAFVALQDVNSRAAGMASKITYSRQEWCGQIWSQLLFHRDRIQQIRHSYFDGQGDSQRLLHLGTPGIPEDTLLLVARRIAWPRLRLGQSYPLSLLKSMEADLSPDGATDNPRVLLTLSDQRQTTIVPAGRFRTNAFTVRWPDGSKRTLDVEADPPFRIVRWASSGGEHAELTGSDRMKYWEMNSEGGEEALKRLGLTRRGPRMP